MSRFINVQPAAEQRRPFAVWASAQVPKVGTASESSFAVPHDLFMAVPEPVLVGALIDGHRYVSPAEDAAEGRPEPAAPDLLGVATAEGFAPPAPGSPEADAAAMVAATPPETVQAAMDAVLLATDLAALNAAGDEPGSELPTPDPSDSSDPAEDPPEGVFPCGGCDREFTTDRGQQMHYRRIHGEPDTQSKD